MPTEITNCCGGKHCIKNKKQGIVLIVCGHPYYGNYAVQLAASIKYTSPDIDIVVIHDGKGISHLTPEKRTIIDHFIEVPEIYHTNKKRIDYLKLKAHLYELSPFQETIFIDADVLWLPKKPITQLFEQFKDIDFTMSNRGNVKLSEAKENFITWTTPDEIIKNYAIDGTLYNLSSEFIYFKKTKEVKKLFTQTLKNFENLKVNYRLFGNDIPDELPFCIAMIQTGTYPHRSPYKPFYWEQFERKNLQQKEMYTNYYAYSLGGCIQSDSVKRFYDNLASGYLNYFGLGKVFPLKSKRDFLPERTNI
jgi:hypothetical protein